MKKYFLHNGRDKEGPYDLETLRAQNLANDTPIWYEGLADWTEAQRVYELRDLFPFLNDPGIGVVPAPPPFIREEPEKKKRSPGKIALTVIIILALIFVGFILLDFIDSPGLFK